MSPRPQDDEDPTTMLESPVVVAPAEPEPEEEAPGPFMKRIREQQGLSLTELSDRTKITKAILSALEDERYDDLPNARIYVWGFVRCFARELELDMDEMASAYVPRWEQWVINNDIPVD